MSSRTSRRDLLRLGGGALVVGPLLAGCSLLSTDPDTKSPQHSGGGADGALEAPELAEQVTAGKLPPLAERLPTTPMVVQPLEETGRFGGTLRSPAFGTLSDPAQSGLVEWNADYTGVQPGLAEKWEVEDGGRSYVFHLREGLKWSDGQPFTTDDLMFLHDHVFANKTLTPAPLVWLSRDGKGATFEQIDPTTIAITFTQPYSLLLKHIAFPSQGITLIKPAHYLKGFHPDFTEMSELKRLAKEESLPGWHELYVATDDLTKNVDRPVMGAWQLSKAMDTKGQTMTASRNPYFWKTDPDGRQLPYINELSWTASDPENHVLKAANGEFDIDAAFKIADAPILAEKAEAKGFEVRHWQTDGGFIAVYLNQSHPDKVIRSVLGNIDVRAALSHAINRNEINESMLAGQGTISHPCGQPGDPYFEEGMGRRFIEFDVAQANTLLDRAGLTARDGAGMRLRPDGKKLKLQLVAFETPLPVNHIDVYEFVRRYWRAVGIDMDVKVVSTQLWYDSVSHGEFDLMGYACVGYQWDIDPLWYVPTNGYTYFAPRFGNWYANPDDEYAEEPTGDIRQLQLLYDQLTAEIDEAKRLELGRQILRLHDQNVWILGTISPPFVPVVVNKQLANAPQADVISYRTGVNIVACQEFYRTSAGR